MVCKLQINLIETCEWDANRQMHGIHKNIMPNTRIIFYESYYYTSCFCGEKYLTQFYEYSVFLRLLLIPSFFVAENFTKITQFSKKTGVFFSIATFFTEK